MGTVPAALKVCIIYTVKKAKLDAGPKHVWDGKCRHPRKSSGPVYVDDGFFDRSMLTEFSVSYMFRACVTLAFFNSV
jgi:hypothetical protein